MPGSTEKHMPGKVVGVGSVGARACKEAHASVRETYTGASRYRNYGRPVVEGQRLSQAYGDILLGCHSTKFAKVPADYHVRQLRDCKGAAEVADLDPAGLAFYGELCVRRLARAHARSGYRVAIAAYLGRRDAFEQALADFAILYADKSQLDFAARERAGASGRITVRAGV